MVAVRGGTAKENGFFSEESGAGVLHAAVSETGDQDEVVFGKRKGLSEEFRKIVDAPRGSLLDFGSFFFGLFEFGLADVEAGSLRSRELFGMGLRRRRRDTC
jgi:hypothetical protein